MTEKGKKIGEKTKEGEEEKDKKNDAEEFLMDQTQFFSKEKVKLLPAILRTCTFDTQHYQSGSVKKGGRPRKKDLDEKMDGVAKLVRNHDPPSPDRHHPNPDPDVILTLSSS